MLRFLRSMLTEMTPDVAGYFDVRDADGGDIDFRLSEALFIARRAR
jgi:hypothetical protein